MKRFLILLIALILTGTICNRVNAACIQCPEIQKLIKKEFKENDMKLTKEQKNNIKETKKDMKTHMKELNKKEKSIQKKIDKILDADCPDIVSMMALKTEKAKIQKDKMVSKKEFYDELFYIYTPEQQYIAKKVLSENSGIKTKKPCEFCPDSQKLKPECANCNGK